MSQSVIAERQDQRQRSNGLKAVRLLNNACLVSEIKKCLSIELQKQHPQNTKMTTEIEKSDFHQSTSSPLDISGSENFELAIPTYRQMAQHWRSASSCVFRDQCPDHEAESSAVWLKKTNPSETILRSLTKAMKFLYYLFRSGESEDSTRRSKRGSSPATNWTDHEIHEYAE
ncbi:unnamed protein product [Oikopleura dioica]|uniref:Uncharacterized protein n=1 Tax=Oikopleura dioica TaxID=34765 RepID=E4XX00_OIKDI|nr:unnamed protein product [Oikopleura dioica]